MRCLLDSLYYNDSKQFINVKLYAIGVNHLLFIRVIQGSMFQICHVKL